MDQKLKEIVATYINIPGDQITPDTIIDRSKVSSSIVLHRMYAKLAENGFKVNNYWNIKTFGSLLQQNNGEVINANSSSGSVTPPVELSREGFSSGVDLEEIAAMPVVGDFREDSFYQMNFAPAEISYCILQSNPYESFAGLFALKEAIIKCDNSFKNKELNTIIIEHSELGKPIFRDFQVSLSHTGNFAVAIAFRIDKDYFQKNTAIAEPVKVVHHSTPSKLNWVALAALIISLASIGMSFFYINQL